MFHCMLSLFKRRRPNAADFLSVVWDLCTLNDLQGLQVEHTEEGFILKEQQNIWKGIQFQGRHIVTKVGVGALLLTVLAVAFLTTTSTSHAASMATSYTIVSGDTLSGIASQYGVSVSAIASANGIADPNVIYAGQTIQIPGSSASSTSVVQKATSYTIVSGDTLSGIASQYGVSVSAIASANGIADPNVIYARQ